MTTPKISADGADPSWFPRVLRVLARDYPEINDKVWSTAIGENADEQVAKRQEHPADRFAKDIAGRARWARDHGDGYPEPAWSTGERLIVALVLGSTAYIDAEGYSRAEVLDRLAGDIGGTRADAEAWVEEVRGAL